MVSAVILVYNEERELSTLLDSLMVIELAVLGSPRNFVCGQIIQLAST
jgi:hypothetical protein